MKILLTADIPFHGSGLSVLGESCYEGLKKLGHEVVTHSLFDHHGIEKLLQTQKFDIHLGVGYWANSVQQISLPKQYGVPTAVYWVSEGNVPKFQDIIPKADLLLVTSNFSKKVFEKYVPESNPITLYIGCDTNRYYPIYDYYPTHDTPSKIFSTFISSGEVKGAEQGIMAAEQLAMKKMNPGKEGFKYIIHSPHTEYSMEKLYMIKLKNIIETYSMENYVKLILGRKLPKKVMPSLYNSMWFYLSLFRMGCFGIPIIEAGACGIPTIGGNWEPMSEIIIPGKTGILVPSTETRLHTKTMEGVTYTEEWEIVDVKILANEIEWLLENEEERNRLGKNAREHIVENFNEEKQIKKLETELEKIA